MKNSKATISDSPENRSDRVSRYSPQIQISLDNLLHNLKQIRNVDPQKKIMAVVKDRAYGCGAQVISRTLEQNGVDYFVVARADEALNLREGNITKPILVLGNMTEKQMLVLSEQNVEFVLNSIDDINIWSSYGFPIHFHCNIDTGMSRMGILPSEIDTMVSILNTASNLYLEGVFTHFACADEPETKTVAHQFERFHRCLDSINAAGYTPEHIHFSNSAAHMRFSFDESTLVRPGIALYGLRPDPQQTFPLDLRPISTLKSWIVKMKKVPKGTPVSYGGNYSTPAETWIATIAVGYAHGVPRYLSNCGEVLCRGTRYKIAGNVTMDYIMIDAGPDPAVSVGDEVVVFGYQGEQCISPDEIAESGKTIGYEILCNMGTSVDREYILNGKTVYFQDRYLF